MSRNPVTRSLTCSLSADENYSQRIRVDNDHVNEDYADDDDKDNYDDYDDKRVKLASDPEAQKV